MTGVAGAGLVRLRPLGLGDVLDEIFRVYRQRFWLLAALSLLPQLPVLAAQVLSGQADQLAFSYSVFTNLANPNAITALAPPTLNVASILLGYVLILAMLPFLVASVPAAVVGIVTGEKVTVLSTVRTVGRRYFPLLGLALLYAMVALPLSLLLCVGWVPLVFLLVRWCVAVPAMLAERTGPAGALGRSWDLTRDGFWRLLGVLGVMLVLYYVVSSVLGTITVGAILVPLLPPVVRGVLALTVSYLAGGLVYPVVSLCLVLVYFDLRVRRESFDLDQLAHLAEVEAESC